ncbi:MAG: HzsA-related protein, partial [Planctomycetota bacterium]
MIRPRRHSAFGRRPLQSTLRAWLAVLGVAAGALAARAEPTPQQTAYWWQDEIRQVCFALATATEGRVAQWPRMSIPAGAATMPMPPADGPISPDGRLDEEAWKHATRFPVGPIFDDWRLGPFTLEVRVCRDEEKLYLAIVSPRDVTGLGALTPDGELFTVDGKAFHVGPGGGLSSECIGTDGEGQVVELALPARDQAALSFAVEAIRRRDGKLPPEFAHLGLARLATPGASRDFRKPTLWLAPIQVRLVASDAAVRISATPHKREGQTWLSSEVLRPGQPPIAAEIPLDAKRHGGVCTWQCEVKDEAFSMGGLLYVEPVLETLTAAREIIGRSAATGSAAQGEAPTVEEITAVESEARAASPDDRKARRRAYCRARELRARAHLSLLDAPLLFVKQHPYFAGHIYDDYYTWHPGGGIYVLQEPHRPGANPKVHTIIDPTTPETLGEGVYRDAELSWDARRIVFANKPTAEAVTSVYQIGVDGRGLTRLTTSDKHHDVTPAYLPDDRIVFTSTRPKALVPCFNSGVDTLHTMNHDGSDVRSISSNIVTEFDPAVMPDGRILYGRWEYVDKTALYMQSLWTVLPDGRMEEALFGNNLAKPTAILDARPVPESRLVVASLTPHNGQAVGAIGMIDTARGKNDLGAVFNFTPEYPVEMDQGLRSGPCDPWPLSPDDVLMANNAVGAHGIIELVDRAGHRELVHWDPSISCYSPMLVKPRGKPPAVSSHARPAESGRFLLVDVDRGLEGVPRGTVKRLRIVEETARVSGIPPGGRWWNQAFLVSWQGAYIVKNVLGTVPVHEDGSAYFEVPSGRAVYLEALDAEGREIQRMRTLVQASPGVTRSCIGCHENKKTTSMQSRRVPLAMLDEPARPEHESWGRG